MPIAVLNSDFRRETKWKTSTFSNIHARNQRFVSAQVDEPAHSAGGKRNLNWTHTGSLKAPDSLGSRLFFFFHFFTSVTSQPVHLFFSPHIYVTIFTLPHYSHLLFLPTTSTHTEATLEASISTEEHLCAHSRLFFLYFLSPYRVQSNMHLLINPRTSGQMLWKPFQTAAAAAAARAIMRPDAEFWHLISRRTQGSISQSSPPRSHFIISAEPIRTLADFCRLIYLFSLSLPSNCAAFCLKAPWNYSGCQPESSRSRAQEAGSAHNKKKHTHTYQNKTILTFLCLLPHSLPPSLTFSLAIFLPCNHTSPVISCQSRPGILRGFHQRSLVCTLSSTTLSLTNTNGRPSPHGI